MNKPRNLYLRLWFMVLVRLLGPFLDNVRLEHGGLPHVLPHTVHLIFSVVAHKTVQSPNFPFCTLDDLHGCV